MQIYKWNLRSDFFQKFSHKNETFVTRAFNEATRSVVTVRRLWIIKTCCSIREFARPWNFKLELS
jgi:hypothetical protein